jgi:hypothetical protein
MSKAGTDAALQLAAEMGYTFPVDKDKDRGVPGRFHASHVEAQLVALAPNQAIGVSRGMCPTCRSFVSSVAQYRDQAQVVADPYRVRVFYPDGTIRSIPR